MLKFSKLYIYLLMVLILISLCLAKKKEHISQRVVLGGLHTQYVVIHAREIYIEITRYEWWLAVVVIRDILNKLIKSRVTYFPKIAHHVNIPKLISVWRLLLGAFGIYTTVVDYMSPYRKRLKTIVWYILYIKTTLWTT